MKDKLKFAPEELEILFKDGTLLAENLTDDELEYCLNQGWLEWTRENCKRLLK